jgi:hypothetical protein
MDFQRVLQQSQSYFENPAKQSDATKQILEQGENFQKTMAGERGIMAAIEGAHLRPKIQKFIQSKLNGLSSDDVLKGVRNIGTRLNGEPSTVTARPTSELPSMRTPGVGGTVREAPRGQIRGPTEAPLQESSRVLTGRTNDAGLIEEGGQFRLAPGRGIGDRFGPEFQPSQASSRLTRDLDASNNPLNPRNVANVGQSETVPELDTPENLPGLRGPVAVSREALATQTERIPATTSEQIASLGSSVASRVAQSDIPDIPESTEFTGALAGGLGGKRPIFRTPQDRVDSMGGRAPQPSPDDEAFSESQVEAQAQRVAAQGEAQSRAIPKPTPEPSQAGSGTPTPEDFPSPPSSRPPPARGETDEEMAQRLSRVQEIGSGEEETTSALSSIGSSIAGSFGKALGFAGDIGEGAGIISALASKGLTGNQRLGQISQTLAPRVAGKVSSTVTDQFGLPKTGTSVKPLTSDLQEQADKQLAEKLAAQTTKEAVIGSEEAAVPGVGDILAIGTALFGAIRSGIEAEKSKKEVQAYKPPPTPQVAMDNAPTFDSSFR